MSRNKILSSTPPGRRIIPDFLVSENGKIFSLPCAQRSQKKARHNNYDGGFASSRWAVITGHASFKESRLGYISISLAPSLSLSAFDWSLLISVKRRRHCRRRQHFSVIAFAILLWRLLFDYSKLWPTAIDVFEFYRNSAQYNLSLYIFAFRLGKRFLNTLLFHVFI